MYIKRLVIDGFGIFNSYSLELGPGLTLLYGPNEAGKTTLMAFIRAMFFGFPDGRTKENRYEPLRGGTHGGRLFLEADGGREYILTLREGPGRGNRSLRLADGSPSPIGLDQLLGGVSEELFKNVFAIGLKELEELHTLQGEGVASHIYSAGLGLAANSLPKINQRLEEDARKLFLPRGRTPLLNKILQELEGVEREIGQARSRMEEYNDLKLQYVDTEEKLARLGEKLNSLQEEEGKLLRLQQAWPTWEQLVQVRRKMERLPQLSTFPHQGVIRLENLEERLKELEEHVVAIEEERERLTREREALAIDWELLGHGNQISLLEEERALFNERLEQLPILRRDLEQLKKSWEELSHNLGSGWTRNRILDFDTSLDTRAQVENIARQLQELGRQEEQARFRLEQAQDQLGPLEEEMELSRQAWEDYHVPASPTQYSLTEREQAFQEAQEVLGDLKQAEQELRHRQELQALNGAPGSRWLQVAAGFLASLGGGWFWLQGETVAAVVSLFVGFGVILALRRGIHGGDRGVLQQEIVRIGGEVKREQDRLKDLAGKLTGEAELSSRQLGQLRLDLDRERQAVAEKSRLEQVFRDKEGEYRRCLKETGKLRTLWEEKARALETASYRWEKWLKERKLDLSLTPRQVEELVAEVARSRDLLRQLERKGEEVKAVEAFLEDYRQRVDSLLAAWGRPPAQELNQVGGAVKEIFARYQESGADWQRDRELERRLEENKGREKKLQIQMEQVQGDRTALLAEAGAKDSTHFRLLAGQYRERSDLEGREAELVGILTALSPGGKEEELEEILQETTEIDVTSQLEELAATIREVKKEMDFSRHELGRLGERMEKLEEAEDLSSCLLRKEVLKNQVQDYALQWAAYKVAQKALHLARRKYERERQPEVLKATSSLFNTITGGRFERVWAPLGEETLFVTDRDGTELSPGCLSRGTAEQLFLAMRLGLVQEYSRQAPALPLVLDDILVNFDRERLDRTLKVLGEFSSSQQVLLFTCHSHVTDRARKVVAEAKFAPLS